MRPLISVIVPVYNVEAYLCFCLDSVLSQTLQDFEVICIDDASSDSSYKILSEYAHKDSRIHVLRNGQNKGLSYTRNVGLDAATGTYIYFLDADDTIVPECLEKACHAAEENAADFVMFGSEILQDGKKSVYVSYSQTVCDKIWSGRELFVFLQDNYTVNSCVPFKLWRAYFLSKFRLRFYKGIYYEDTLFNFSALMHAERVVCIPDMLYLYNRRCESIITGKKSFKDIYSYIICIDETVKLFSKNINMLSPAKRKAFFDYIAVQCQYTMSLMSMVGLEKLPDDSEMFDFSKRNLYLFLRAMASCKCGETFCLDELNRLRSFEHILVYGAGKVARRIIPELLKNGMENLDVVVTSKGRGEDALYGFPIKEIGSMQYPKENCVVLVAVGASLTQEVMEGARKLGYENVLVP